LPSVTGFGHVDGEGFFSRLHKFEGVMIRFVDIGRQLAVDEKDESEPRQFAFYNTIYNQFVKINGYHVFDSLADLIQEMEQEDSMTAEFATRLISLTPEWVRTVPAPRSNMQIFGIKG
jgi:hypothetical protein